MSDKSCYTSAPTVVLVDDDPDFARLWQCRLTRQGFRVVAVSGSVEALAYAHAHPGATQVFLVDLLLAPPSLRLASDRRSWPRVHGDRLATMLHRRDPSAAILLMSAYSDRELTRHGIGSATTVFPFLRKPLDETEVVTTLRNLVAEGRLAGSRTARPASA